MTKARQNGKGLRSQEGYHSWQLTPNESASPEFRLHSKVIRACSQKLSKNEAFTNQRSLLIRRYPPVHTCYGKGESSTGWEVYELAAWGVHEGMMGRIAWSTQTIVCGMDCRMELRPILSSWRQRRRSFLAVVRHSCSRIWAWSTLQGYR